MCKLRSLEDEIIPIIEQLGRVLFYADKFHDGKLTISRNSLGWRVFFGEVQNIGSKTTNTPPCLGIREALNYCAEKRPEV